MYVCLWSHDWSTDGASGVEDLAPLLASLAPRMRVEREVLWADGRGLSGRRLAERFVEQLAELGVSARAGVAAVPVAAELAARLGTRSRDGEGPTPFLVKERTGWGWRRSRSRSEEPSGESSNEPSEDGGGGSAGDRSGSAVVVVPDGEERAWLAALPVTVLSPPDPLRTLLEGVGVHTLGSLAALEREAVEVRLGASAVDLWRLARADDRRLLFDRIPPERPHGSLDFVDYVLTDPARLLFTANALLGPLCDGMTGRGEHARTLHITLPLANGGAWKRTIRPARPTASRDTWLRLIRELLDRLTVPDAVSGMRIEVGITEEAAVRQGDLFDRGFATAAAVEAAVARLAERQVHPLTPETNGHSLVERRGQWAATSTASSLSPPAAGRAKPEAQAPTPVPGGSREASPPSTEGGEGGEEGRLGLQLLARPRPVAVQTTGRRDHEVPVRLRDRQRWRDLLVASGPDRISGGQWEEAAYAREYYRCVTEEGAPLWIYRDALTGDWYLHGWWD